MSLVELALFAGEFVTNCSNLVKPLSFGTSMASPTISSPIFETISIPIPALTSQPGHRAPNETLPIFAGGAQPKNAWEFLCQVVLLYSK